MKLMQKYKTRLEQLKSGYKEIYEGETQVIISILESYNRL